MTETVLMKVKSPTENEGVDGLPSSFSETACIRATRYKFAT
jgi:hypothetical protein